MADKPLVARKILLIVLDGGADRPVNGTTPLASAFKPNLDALACGGINGIMDTVGIGVRPGSDVSHLALLGYDPYEYYTGRGPFEAAKVEEAVTFLETQDAIRPILCR